MLCDGKRGVFQGLHAVYEHVRPLEIVVVGNEEPAAAFVFPRGPIKARA